MSTWVTPRLAQLVGALLVGALLTACMSQATDTASESWLGINPGDAQVFHGSTGDLILVYVDETYDVAGEYVSALTWEEDGAYTTDFFLEDGNQVWWYGRRGVWRVGKNSEQRKLAGDRTKTVTFGDRSLILGPEGPTMLNTPRGSYAP